MCNNIVVFASLIPLVIVLGAGANLATIANTISIEKDWIVVLADKQKDTLAGEWSMGVPYYYWQCVLLQARANSNRKNNIRKT